MGNDNQIYLQNKKWKISFPILLAYFILLDISFLMILPKLKVMPNLFLLGIQLLLLLIHKRGLIGRLLFCLIEFTIIGFTLAACLTRLFVFISPPRSEGHYVQPVDQMLLAVLTAIGISLISASIYFFKVERNKAVEKILILINIIFITGIFILKFLLGIHLPRLSV